MAWPVSLVSRDHKELKEIPASLEPLDHKEALESLEQLDRKAVRVVLELREQLDLRVGKDRQESLAQLDRKDLLGSLELLVRLVLMRTPLIMDLHSLQLEIRLQSKYHQVIGFNQDKLYSFHQAVIIK
jgi:hypothetical protein